MQEESTWPLRRSCVSLGADRGELPIIMSPIRKTPGEYLNDNSENEGNLTSGQAVCKNEHGFGK